MNMALFDPSNTLLGNLPSLLPKLEALYKDVHAHLKLSIQENRTAGSVFEGRAKFFGRNVEEEAQLALVNQSVEKFIDPTDIAGLAVFLAGPHARTISGQMFPINGDSKSST